MAQLPKRTRPTDARDIMTTRVVAMKPGMTMAEIARRPVYRRNRAVPVAGLVSKGVSHETSRQRTQLQEPGLRHGGQSHDRCRGIRISGQNLLRREVFEAEPESTFCITASTG